MVAVRTEQLAYSGRRGQLYRIFLTNLGLSVVTLTIYRFWGRARMRRYLWGQTEFEGDRFEWSGTGGEMFRAFLIAAVVLLVLTLMLTLAQLLAQDSAVQLSIARIIYPALLLFLGCAASFWGLRYRLSRTHWRGIRGALSGSGWGYALRAFGWSILKPGSLMALKPFADVALARYRIDRISIGDAAARCNAHAVAVYGTYSTAWGVAFVATVCWIALILNVFPAAVRTLTIALGELANRTQIDPTANFLKVALIAALVAVGAVAYLLLVLVWALCFVAYRAALIRHIAATTEVAACASS